ncbi:MAG: pyridoxamine 5'-phosphate oxidase family protein [Opitutaceae bacterium]
MIDKTILLTLLNEADAVYLATIGKCGPRIRAMENLRRNAASPDARNFWIKEGFTVYFSTSAASGKVSEIRETPLATAYFADPRRTFGVELSGTIEVLNDPDLKKRLWNDVWRIYWRLGPDDPDYLLLRLQPRLAAGWKGTKPFKIDLCNDTDREDS